MAFGRGKKRESWSSRSLSMILPDNVKLFQRKGKSVMDKVLQDQSKRAITFEASSPARNDIASMKTPKASPKSAQTTSKSLVQEPIQEAAEHQAPTTSENQQIETERQEDLTNLPEQAEPAPFLTLNLGDTPSSLLDLSDKYSSLDGQTTPEDGVNNVSHSERQIDTSAADVSHDGSQAYSYIDSDTPDLSAGDSSDHTDATADYKLPESETLTEPLDASLYEAASADIAALNIDDKQWVVRSRDAPVVQSISELDLATLPTNLHDSMCQEPADIAGASDVPSLEHPTRQDSTVSSDSPTSEVHTPDEFLLEPNRKIMVSHGVFIFDPADEQDLVHLKLSADESYNPFEY